MRFCQTLTKGHWLLLEEEAESRKQARQIKFLHRDMKAAAAHSPPPPLHLRALSKGQLLPGPQEQQREACEEQPPSRSRSSPLLRRDWSWHPSCCSPWPFKGGRDVTVKSSWGKTLTLLGTGLAPRINKASHTPYRHHAGILGRASPGYAILFDKAAASQGPHANTQTHFFQWAAALVANMEDSHDFAQRQARRPAGCC